EKRTAHRYPQALPTPGGWVTAAPGGESAPPAPGKEQGRQGWVVTRWARIGRGRYSPSRGHGVADSARSPSLPTHEPPPWLPGSSPTHDPADFDADRLEVGHGGEGRPSRFPAPHRRAYCESDSTPQLAHFSAAGRYRGAEDGAPER